jgi:hypothetical protein
MGLSTRAVALRSALSMPFLNSVFSILTNPHLIVGLSSGGPAGSSRSVKQ